MSINHFSTELPEAHWWSHYKMDHIHSPPAKTSSPIYHNNHNNNNNNNNISTTASSSPAFCLSPHTLYRAAAPMFCNQSAAIDLNNEEDDDDESEQEMAKERLFEKPLTPSDVGKLNRLVIPKQHAEKHFPLNGTADSGENGLLLGFEDELGKSWRFRYSYWNSSQSYVLTKGWSRFVKEKHLDAGDVVVFARHPVDTGRLFIGWRRRTSTAGHDAAAAAQPAASGGAWNRVIYPGRPYPVPVPVPVPVQQQPLSSSPHFQSDSAHAAAGGGGGGGYNPNQKPTSSAGSGNSKTLRLFGVNLECQPDESDASTPLGSPISGTAQGQGQGHPYHQQQQYHHYYSNNHMDISFSGADVYRQG